MTEAGENRNYLSCRMSEEVSEIIRVLQLTTYDEDEWDSDKLTVMRKTQAVIEGSMQKCSRLAPGDVIIFFIQFVFNRRYYLQGPTGENRVWNGTIFISRVSFMSDVLVNRRFCCVLLICL